MSDWTTPEDVPAATVDHLHRWLLQEGNPADAATVGERAVADIIRAFWPIPAPTLADDLARITEHWETWTTDDITEELTAATNRAKQVDHDRDDARAEVERLTAERDTMSAMVHSLNDDLAELRGHQPMPVHPSDQQSNTQGILAGSLPDPADVKPGEPWLIRVGEREAVANRDGTSEWWTWSVSFFDGGSDDIADKNVTLVSRLVPAPRVITNPDDLDRLAEGSIVRDRAGHAWERYPDEDWYSTEELDDGFSSRRLANYAGPVTVLWEPQA